MPLPLPKLDDRTYQDLVAEAQALIPTFDREWTNLNPSDPGVTLVELFAWLAEMLVYRIDRVAEQRIPTLLKLLRDPDQAWQPSSDPADDIRRTVGAVRERYRTVTCQDYEAIALEAVPTPLSSGETIARTRCIARRDLSALDEADRLVVRPGHVSVILVPSAPGPSAWPTSPPYSTPASPLLASPPTSSPPQGSPPFASPPSLWTTPGLAPQPSDELLQAVADYLEPRRILTTRNHVVGPVYAPLSVEIVLARKSDTPEPVGGDLLTLPRGGVPESDVRRQVLAALARFLDPLMGGVDGRGWPFGRAVYISELYQVLASVPGVDYVPDLSLSSSCSAEALRCQEALPMWHDNGDLIGLALAPHHLPAAQFDPRSIVFGTVFVRAEVTLHVTPSATATAAEACRAARNAVRRLFHPLHGGPNGTRGQEIGNRDIRGAVVQLAEISGVAGLPELDADADHLRYDQVNGWTFVRFDQNELAELQVTVLTA